MRVPTEPISRDPFKKATLVFYWQKFGPLLNELQWWVSHGNTAMLKPVLLAELDRQIVHNMSFEYQPLNKLKGYDFQKLFVS